MLIRLLREKLEALIPQNIGLMATLATQWRNAVKAKFPQLTQRRRFWEKLFTHQGFQRLTETHQIEQAEALFQQELKACRAINIKGVTNYSTSRCCAVRCFGV